MCVCLFERLFVKDWLLSWQRQIVEQDQVLTKCVYIMLSHCLSTYDSSMNILQF